MLYIILPVIPFIGALFLFIKKDRPKNVSLIVSALILILSGIGLKNIFEGNPFPLKIPLAGPFSPAFQIDHLSAVFIVLAGLLWLVVSLYAPEYMKKEGGIWDFQLPALLTLSAVLGVFAAGSLFTMLLFFELMTITSYFWVVHRWDKEAIKAGYFYLFFSIIGGLLIALGIMLMSASVDVLPAIGSGRVIPNDPHKFALSILLLVAGFGIKAGMVPLHIWLPHAHSAAPTPGSALLSGLLIKVGAYGLIRTGEFAGWGIKAVSETSWLGPVLAVLGTLTMLAGVTAALLQSNGKRLLAYHSVSQMGYIILGLGIGLYLGPEGGLGLLGAIYHIVNHALFKTVLFLGVGVIYLHTKETDLYRLGGLLRHFPVTALLMFIAVLGITGAPGLNGYASKTMLHHAVSQAAETGASWAVWLERLFVLVGVGTAASFSKLYYLIFLSKPLKKEVTGKESFRQKLSLGILAVIMVVIGLQPGLLPNTALIPAAEELGMKSSAATFAHFSFWNPGDVISMFITLALGILVCWAGLKSGAFHWQPYSWLTLEGLAKAFGRLIYAVVRKTARICRSIFSAAGNAGNAAGSRLFGIISRFDRSRSGKFGGIILSGISADAALLIIVLIALIIWYTLINPDFPGIKLSSFLSIWIKK